MIIVHFWNKKLEHQKLNKIKSHLSDKLLSFQSFIQFDIFNK